jgi:hypothetical protein
MKPILSAPAWCGRYVARQDGDYPIRPAGADGLQLVNWVAEIETPNYLNRDWTRSGAIGDFIGAFADCISLARCSLFIRAADSVLEFPMVDQDLLPRWSFGRVTLSDAAHDGAARLQRRRSGDPGCGALASALSETTIRLPLAAYEKRASRPPHAPS